MSGFHPNTGIASGIAVVRGERVSRCSEITWILLIPHEPGSIVPYNNQLVYQDITGLIPTHEIFTPALRAGSNEAKQA